MASTNSPAQQPGVLIVDASLTVRMDLEQIFESAGYRATLCGLMAEARQAAATGEYAVSVVDVVLPDGDGLDFIGELRAGGRRMAVMLLSTEREVTERAAEFPTEGVEFIGKPYDGAQVLRRAHELSGPYGPPGQAVPKRILAVDDSITFLNEVATELRCEGYDVIEAQSGEQALELIESQTVDCILLDVRMPGLSGNEVCRTIKGRSSLRNVPLLMLTAAEDAESTVEGMDAGADDYVSKAGDLAVLKARVRAQLRRKEFEDEYRRMRDELLSKELEASQAKAAAKLAEARAMMVEELEAKNRELDSFAHAVSHDLRAPLRTVNAYSQFLLDEFGAQLPPGAHEHLGRIQHAGSRMGRLIEALLELSRSGRASLNREFSDLSQMARTAILEITQANPDYQIAWIVEDGLTAKVDRALAQVVLNNILGNAAKFSAKSARPEVRMGAVREPGRTVFFVRDNGVGFDPAWEQKLFQPFERLHPAAEFPGAGVGLATVRRIVDRHRGEVWAESTPGQGAAFFFTFEPAAATESA